MPKKALISGVSGQDGSYLAELLLGKGYEVHGMVRRSSLEQKLRFGHLYEAPQSARNRFHVHYGDVTDALCIQKILAQVKPDEVYNLAAQSHVRISFETPEYTANADAIGPLRILEAIRSLGLKDCRFYQASTSELFGKVKEVPQNEETPFYPRSPYGTAKLYAYWCTVNYREAYDLFACNGILFNHESPRRGNSFVTKKITSAVASIQRGDVDTIYLGNLDAKRDWGFAPEYVHAMWQMLQTDEPEDFVVATGICHSVREFVEQSFAFHGEEISWDGEGLKEVGVAKKSGKVVVRVDPWYFRPTEVEILLGDPTKASVKLGWKAETKFEQLVELMMRAEVEGEIKPHFKVH